MVALTRRAIMCPMSLAEIFTALDHWVSVQPMGWDPQDHPPTRVGTYLATSLKVFLLVTVVPLET